MFTTSVLLRAKPQEQPVPRVVIIWKQVYGHWDFFARAAVEEAEHIVALDVFQSGLDRTHYKVTQG